MSNKKLFSFALIILIFIAANTTAAPGMPADTVIPQSGTSLSSENNPSSLSLGIGRMFDFRDDSELNLLLSADFTLYFNPSFFIKLNYDYVFSRGIGNIPDAHRDLNLFSISPGICIGLNKLTAVHLSAGLGIANDMIPFFPVAAFEFEYKLSKRFSSGIEIKYPVGGRVLPVNFNVIYYLY